MWNKQDTEAGTIKFNVPTPPKPLKRITYNQIKTVQNDNCTIFDKMVNGLLRDGYKILYCKINQAILIKEVTEYINDSK